MGTRLRCYDCYRPQAQCLCDSIETVEHRTGILILQHPRERSHAFNTARLAERSLARADVVVGHGHELAADESLAERMQGFGLLYPSPQAKDLSKLAPSERPSSLVVIDGTWHHARAMYRDIRALHDLPHFTLPSGQVSGFKIRKQPASYCLSTLEAIQSALECLEPDNERLDSLLRPFEEMQTRHIESLGDPVPRRKRPRNKPPGARVLETFSRDFDQLVVVYAEVSPHALGRKDRSLVTLAAERPATGERLRCILVSAPIGGPSWPFLRLGDDDLRASQSIESVREQWQDFARPSDIVVAWSQATIDVIRAQLGMSMTATSMKTLYLNQRRHRGCLDDIVVGEGLVSDAEFQRLRNESDRTEERLQHALTMTRLLRSLGSSQ